LAQARQLRLMMLAGATPALNLLRPSSTKNAMRHSQDAIHRVRHEYATTDKPVAQIARENGMSSSTMYYWLDGGPPTGPLHLEPIPRRKDGAVRSVRRRLLTGDRVAIVQRIWRTAEAQVRDIEDRLIKSGQAPDDRERDTRAMAVLVKAIRELSTLNESTTDPAATTERARDDDEVPRDIDEFRRALAERIEAFVERRTGSRVADE
jgi:hypothetical protein